MYTEPLRNGKFRYHEEWKLQSTNSRPVFQPGKNKKNNTQLERERKTHTQHSNSAFNKQQLSFSNQLRLSFKASPLKSTHKFLFFRSIKINTKEKKETHSAYTIKQNSHLTPLKQGSLFRFLRDALCTTSASTLNLDQISSRFRSDTL